ncbi:MAG: hypothetical protein WCO69_01435 [Candidatus Omnitrophota bacterium]
MMKSQITFLKYTLCFLLFLEMFLWIGSWITQGTQKINNTRQATASGTYKIICVGESNTLVGGKDSYPSQLQVILNEKLPGRRIDVVNQGMAGYSTARIAGDLPQWIRELRPDMVIAMVGIFDGEQTRRDQIKSSSPFGFMHHTKLYQLAVKMQQKAAASLQEYAQRQQKQFRATPASPLAGVPEQELFGVSIKNAPDELKKIYMLIAITEGNAKYEMADQLYANFFELNKDPIIYGWVIKQYGRFLMKAHLYEKFITVMENIPTNAWTMEWVNGYCNSDDHVAKVKAAIDEKVRKTNDTDAYGYVASCYEKNGQKALAEAYIRAKIGTFRDSYASASTRKSYREIKDLLIANHIQPVFVQYPLRNARPLLDIFEGQPDREKIIFVDNGPAFQKAVAESSYTTYFKDRASGDTGHATPLGNHLLASNIADAIIPFLRK